MIDARLLVRLHTKARASQWRVSVDTFGQALDRSAQKAFVDRSPSAADVEGFLSGLHLEDLALACACADGDDGAWEHFVTTFRPTLFRAADAIDRTGGSHDVVDSLYGELFGVARGDGPRQSLFRYFHGRSSLATWLRSVLSQRIIDRARERRHTESLPDDDAPEAPASPAVEIRPERRRFVGAMRAALLVVLRALSATDRLRLACYYAQQMTLAQVGRLLGEHEATASRNLARTRASIRSGVEAHLRTAHGFSDDELSECFASLSEDVGPLDLSRLFDAAGTPPLPSGQPPPVERKISRAVRSRKEGDL